MLYNIISLTIMGVNSIGAGGLSLQPDILVNVKSLCLTFEFQAFVG